MYHRVEVDSPLHKLLIRALEAYETRTSQWSNISVLQALDELSRKVDELMSTQEERLRNIQTALGGIADGINRLQQQVQDLKVNNPEMEDELAGIESTVQAIADDINGVTTPTPGEGGTEGESETSAPTPEGEGGVTP